MKKRTKIILGVIVAFFVIGIINSIINPNPESSQTDSAVDSGNSSNVAADSSDNYSDAASDDAASNDSVDALPDFPDSIGDVDISFSDLVNDDVTDNWRIARVSSSENTIDYALDYYKHFFSNDDEIHWIVNFSNNTTSSLRVSSGLLFVDEYEYVKDEELSAKTLGGGMLLAEYSIDLNSEKVEQLQ